MKLKVLSKSFAFSLAEVLITLGIIGIIAALTIPVLQKNIQDAQYKTAYKKAYSALSQAVNDANANCEFIEGSSTGSPTNFSKNFFTIMSKFQVVKKCINYNNSECWSTGEKFDMTNGGLPSQDINAFLDASGMSWSMYYWGHSFVLVDTNGFKKPNQYGKDRFAFSLLSKDNSVSGIPTKVKPFNDNNGFTCYKNKCGTVGDPDYQTYYGTSWLYK